METRLTTLLSIFTSALLLIAVPGAFATNQVVTDAGDNGGPNQLRAKLAALQNTGGGTLTFNTGAATIVLLQGQLPAITTNSTINGAGNITISGNNASRILVINGGATLTLQNITISNGYSSGGDGGAVFNFGTLNVTASKFLNNQTSASFSGGAIITYGPLNITNSEFGGNKAGSGGAVYPRFSPAVTTITSCNFHDNEAISTSGSGWGGALLLWDGTDVTISNSTFSNNRAPNEGSGGAMFITVNSKLTLKQNTVLGGNYSRTDGGGIYNLGAIEVTNTTFNGNSAIYQGGGLYNRGVATLTQVSFDGNRGDEGGAIQNHGSAALISVTLSGSSAYSGGAIENGSTGTLTITNSTLSGNSADLGGGIFTYGGTTTLTNVTLRGNSGRTGAGGIYKAGGTCDVKNTLIAKGASGNNSNGPLGGSFNLSDDYSCGFGPGRDNVTDLLLGPLANNGGFTKTHLPQAGSRAIDNGTGFNAPPTDQRGIQRPQGLAVDVGAVEATVPLVENAHPYVQYDGWRGFKNASANGGYYRMSNVTNDAVTYKFTGTSIKWITRKGPNMGKALVTIDGLSKGTYDLYSSSTLWKQQLLFGGLTNAAHTVIIKVTGTKNASATDFNVALDGFLVGSSTTVVQESVLNVQCDGWLGVKQTAASGGSYRSNGTLGAVARFRFNGSAITFLTARGPSYGKMNVLIDGVLKSSNLDLYVATQQWQYGFQYSGLTNANHTIEIRPTHTKNASSSGYSVVVDAFSGWFTALP